MSSFVLVWLQAVQKPKKGFPQAEMFQKQDGDKSCRFVPPFGAKTVYPDLMKVMCAWFVRTELLNCWFVIKQVPAKKKKKKNKSPC